MIPPSSSQVSGRGLYAILALVVIIVILLALSAFYVIHSNLIVREGQFLAAIASGIADRLNNTVRERLDAILLLAESHVIQGGDVRQIADRLEAVEQQGQAFLALEFVDLDGRVIASSQGESLARKVDHTQIFQNLIRHKSPQLEDASKQAMIEGKLAVTLGAPVISEEGQLKGLVIAYLGVQNIGEEIEGRIQELLAVGHSVPVLEWQILKTDGTVILDSVLQESGEVNLLTLQLPSAVAALSLDTGFVEELHLRRNVPVVTGYARMPEVERGSGFRWAVLLRNDRAEVLAKNKELETKIALAGTGIGLPLIGVLIYFTRRLQGAQKETLEALELIKEEEQRLSSMTNQLVLATRSAQMGIWDWDIQSNVLVWDDQMYALYGTHVDEFSGAYEAWTARVHPDDLARGQEEIQQALRGEKEFNTEFRAVWPDQSVHWIEAHALVERDAQGQPVRMIGVNRDITHGKQAEEQFRQVVEAAPSGMIMVDAQGQIVLANALTCDMFGYAREELLGQPIERLVPERFRAGHPEKRTGYFGHPEPRAMGSGRDLYGLRKGGTEFAIEIGLNPLRTDQGHFVLASVVDITERKQGEEALRAWTTALERSNKELDDFAYIASHDLKEPLRGIHNYSKFLTEDYAALLGEEGNEQCQTIMRLSQRMEELINTLLYFSRIGRADLAMRDVDLDRVVLDVVETLKPRLEELGVHIRYPQPLPLVYCDEARVGEIFRNLITNAMKYNDKDDKWIEIGYVEKGPISSGRPEPIGDTPPGGESGSVVSKSPSESIPGPLAFYVRDNGIGIPEKHFENVFRIFKRLQGRDKFGGGTGAGLTILQKIVHRHGGNIWIESTVGEGSTFWFTLEAGGSSSPLPDRNRGVVAQF